MFQIEVTGILGHLLTDQVQVSVGPLSDVIAVNEAFKNLNSRPSGFNLGSQIHLSVRWAHVVEKRPDPSHDTSAFEKNVLLSLRSLILRNSAAKGRLRLN